MTTDLTLPVDLLLINGRIWTGSETHDSDSNEVSALAIRDGRIIATGT